jgi:hypothetical protein
VRDAHRKDHDHFLGNADAPGGLRVVSHFTFHAVNLTVETLRKREAGKFF